MAKIDLVTNALSTVNRNKISLYKEPDRITVIDSLIYSAPHPQRTWVFYNLVPGDNYYFRWTEIDVSGNDIQTYNAANFTVDANNIEIRNPFNLVVGLTPNVVNGAVTALLDGSNGSPDFRGWEIVPFLEGSNFMQKDVDYTWNATTGLFTLMNGNVFVDGVRYFIQFTPRSGANNSGNVIVRDVWSSNLIITDSLVLTANDFNNKNAIIMGIHSYLLITLPDISLVAPNKLLYFDSAPGFHKCAEITCSTVAGNANKIHWPTQGRRSLYMGQGETFAIYRDQNTNVWRVKFADGNFKTVGEFVSEFATDVINKIPLDGGQYDAFEYGRLYNDVILKLPSYAVVPFNSWVTNPQKFSSADANGKFHVPFGTSLYEMGSGSVGGTTYNAGSYLPDEVGSHSHQIAYSMNGTDGTPNGQHLHPGGAAPENNPTGLNPTAIQANTGTVTRPKTIVVNKYIRV